MEADWILRAAMGAGVSDETFPPRTRQLTAPQVLRLWQDLRDSGLVDETPEAAGTDLVYTIYFAGGGVRRALKLDRDSYPGAQRLVDDMAALAWVQE
jgi:hypothetical protein